MRRVLVVALFVLIPSLVWGAPFLVCDPQAGVTHYKLTGPAWVPATTPAQTDGSIKLDVSASPTGNNALTVAACVANAVWGELCSTTSPFSFVRPGAPIAPVNSRLAP